MDLDPLKDAEKAVKLTRRHARAIELSRDAQDDIDTVLSDAAEELKYFCTADILRTTNTLAVDDELVFAAQGDDGQPKFFSIPTGSLDVHVTRTKDGTKVSFVGKNTGNELAYTIERASNGIWNFTYDGEEESAFNPTNLEVLNFVTNIANMGDTKPGDGWRDRSYPAENDEMASSAISELAEAASVTTDRELIFLDPKVLDLPDYKDGEISRSNLVEVRRGITIHESNDIEEIMAIFSEPLLAIGDTPRHYVKRTVIAATKRRKALYTKNVSARLIVDGTPQQDRLAELADAENDELLRNILVKNIPAFVVDKLAHSAA